MGFDVKAAPESDLLTADIEGLLHFFDEKPVWSVGHATGVVGVVGEDLNTACLQRYLESTSGNAEVLHHPFPRFCPVCLGYGLSLSQ